MVTSKNGCYEIMLSKALTCINQTLNYINYRILMERFIILIAEICDKHRNN